MGRRVRTIIIEYDCPIEVPEIPLFRGAVIDAIGEKADIMYHNHGQDGVMYRYPRIQYKRIHGNASIFAIEDGVDAVEQFVSLPQHVIRIGDRFVKLEPLNVAVRQIQVQSWKSFFQYSLRKWLPFNSDNYAEYMKLNGVVQRASFLERVLLANILSFAKGLGIYFEEEIVVEMIDVSEPRLIRYKGVKMMAFDVQFSANVSIPDYAGLGKGVSLGFGMVTNMDCREINN